MAHPGTATTSTDVNGAGTVRIGHEISGIKWVIRQLAVRCDKVGAMNLAADVNGLPVMTPRAAISGVAAQGEPPIELGASETLNIVISGGPLSASIIVAYYYDEVAV